ncbi:MAG TPA: hypothetical protein DEA28_03870 [Firmicutes bacterium]|nr:hypothetical protein [Bacillota bacterium]
MNWIDILIIVITVLIVLGIISSYVYKKIKGIPTNDCGECANKGNALVKAYNKKYHKKCSCKKYK